MAQTELGCVKFFDYAKGYGFIFRGTGGEMFVHQSGIATAKQLLPGDMVQYLVVRNPRRFNSFKAINVVHANINIRDDHTNCINSLSITPKQKEVSKKPVQVKKESILKESEVSEAENKLPHDVDTFIEQCTNWDNTEINEYKSDEGEVCKIVDHYKYFNKEKTKYIQFERYFMNGENVLNFTKRFSDHRCSINEYKWNEVKDDPDRDDKWKKYSKIHNLHRKQEELKIRMPIYQKFCGDNRNSFKFHKIMHDKSFNVDISNFVSFGDYKDTQCIKPQKQIVDGTITGYINTVRPFIAGKYVVTIIYPFSDENGPYTMFHHVNVSPTKLMHQILRLSDWDTCPVGSCNTINRYDWCEWRNWGDTENDQYYKLYNTKSVIYFTSTDHSPCIKKCIKKKSNVKRSNISELNKIYDDNGKVISIAVDMTYIMCEDWLYGKIFQDTNTNKYFGLVVNGHVEELEGNGCGAFDEIKKLYPNERFTSIEKSQQYTLNHQSH